MSDNKNIGQNIIKKQIRYDLEIISDMVKPKSKVLDIGCGDGELLEFLKNEKQVDARGLEISQKLVTKTIEKGISAIQGDGEKDLEFYPDHNFDYVILSQTIQATKNPKKMLEEILRVGRYGIISLPNFANFKNRLHILLKGTMPVNKNLPFTWYDTPNIHFCSIRDFENLCLELDFTIDKKIFLTSKHKLNNFFKCSFFSNLISEYGIFLITKNEFKPSGQEEFAFKTKLNPKFNLGVRSPVVSSYDK